MRYRVIDHCTPETYDVFAGAGMAPLRPCVLPADACAACEECRSLQDRRRAFPAQPLHAPDAGAQSETCGSGCGGPRSRTSTSSSTSATTVTWRIVRAGRRSRSRCSDYYRSFVEGRQDFGHEMLYFDGDRPVAVALVDLLPRAVSAVYCYYEPELRARALGVYSVLRQIELARARGVPIRLPRLLGRGQREHALQGQLPSP